MKLHSTVPCALALAAFAGAVHGQSCPAIDKLDNGNSAVADDNFAAAVSMSFGGLNTCPLLAVGQPGKNAPVSGDNAGGFTVYEKPFGSWIVMFALVNSSGQGGEMLGASIGLADPYLIAGAPSYNANEGRARVYRRPSNGSGFSGAVNLLPSQGGAWSGFGRAVAVSAYGGGWAVVGAPTHSHLGVDSGAAFFYTRNAADNSWSQVYQIWGGDFAANDYDSRGAAVAMAQTTEFAVVGSPERELAGQPLNHGTARVLRRLANGSVSGLSQEVRPPSPEQDEHFGAALAIENDILVVGAPDEDLTLLEGGFMQATDSGAIYIFQRNAQTGDWDFVSKMRSPTPASSAHFGDQVATDGTQITVAEPGTKRVYLFSSSGGAWHYQATVSDPDAPAAGSFGNGVAVHSGDIAVADALDDNNAATNAGAAYTFELAAAAATGDLCSAAIPVPSGDFVGCTDLATPTLSSSTVTTCGNGGGGQGNDVWFTFTPDCSGNAIFDTYGSQFDTVLSVHSGCPGFFGGNTTIACNDDASFAPPNNRASLVTFNFTAGETYLVRVSGYNQASGQFTLRHLFTYNMPTPNDTCANATVVSTGTYAFNTCSAASEVNLPIPCGNTLNMYKDVWFRWNAPHAGPAHVDTCGSTFDTILAVYQGACPASIGSQVACNDDSINACNPSGLSVQSALTFQASAGQSYLVRVGAFYVEGGPGQVTIEQDSCAADFNHDGVVNSQDFFDFLTAFFSQAPASDFNHDATINSQDFFDFLTAFFASC